MRERLYHYQLFESHVTSDNIHFSKEVLSPIEVRACNVFFKIDLANLWLRFGCDFFGVRFYGMVCSLHALIVVVYSLLATICIGASSFAGYYIGIFRFGE